MILKNLKNCLGVRLLSSTLNVMLACEHSELPRASRNIKAIFLNRMYRPGSSANELTLKAKDDYKSISQFGRSMIEMLGVLAIIAVLSVGGIAGYSKAMEKWKADRLVSEYSYLVFGLLSNVNEFQILSKNTDYNTQVGLSNYVKAASLVPETWQYVSSTRMYDSEGNPVLMFSRRNRLVIDIYLGTKLNSNGWVSGKSEGFSVALCREVMLNLTQRLSDAVQFSRFYQWSKMEDSSVYWGNATCSAGRKCLRDLTISEINNICKSCQKDNEACGINMEF